MKEEGISRTEALERLSHQREIHGFLERSGVTERVDFVDLAVRHKPYQVILTFEKDVQVSEIVELVPQSLRRYVKVRKAKHPNSERRSGIGALASAFKAASKNFAVGYDATDELYFVDTDSPATTDLLTPLVPAALRDTVKFNSGALPKATASTTATPTGERSGDWAAGGWWTETVGVPGQYCTLGFPITFGSGFQGILTAGHCTEPKKVPLSDHEYVFPDGYYENTVGNFDYGIYRTDGLLTDYRIYYANLNATPGYATEGWLSTKNFIRLANQWVGMYTCKSGALSGITCGKVYSKTYDWRGSGSSVFVRVASTTAQQGVGGDSGGPVFVTMDNTRPSEVTAAGLLVGGSEGHYYTNVGYTAVVMPIDRIFDHVPSVVLKTMP